MSVNIADIAIAATDVRFGRADIEPPGWNETRSARVLLFAFRTYCDWRHRLGTSTRSKSIPDVTVRLCGGRGRSRTEGLVSRRRMKIFPQSGIAEASAARSRPTYHEARLTVLSSAPPSPLRPNPFPEPAVRPPASAAHRARRPGAAQPRSGERSWRC